MPRAVMAPVSARCSAMAAASSIASWPGQSSRSKGRHTFRPARTGRPVARQMRSSVRPERAPTRDSGMLSSSSSVRSSRNHTPACTVRRGRVTRPVVRPW